MAMAAMEAVRRCVARRGGSRRRGGARGLLRCSRGARWLRLRRAVATGAFGRSGEREPGEGRNERVGERCGASRGVVRSIQRDEGRTGRQGGRWRGAMARARAGHAPLPLSRTKTTEEEAGWAACWLGRPAAAGLRRGGEAQVSPSFFYFCFLIFLTFVLI